MTPSKPDPANDSELNVINAALQHAQAGIECARKAICELRPSDEYVKALDALEAARVTLERVSQNT
ncbi:hypothetical protein CI15_07645 [Paraburkholderia monticola]|uniref:Uncharacterized protein n=1 Tax=Paraburkholderia monticola TaxID=1399968 RepID=A0A149PYH2_9BURK|nr:hypothetical protein [Paraburkholderia monticola]KXU90034.1 hypothetical protein CI15_07645 [Paraburkholderia monticola]